MSYYEYRVVPAPRTLARVQGAKEPEARCGATLEQALNAEGRDGWEFQRIETLTMEVKRGFLSRARAEPMAVMVFRRWVELTASGWDRERSADRDGPGARAGGAARHGAEPPLRSFQDGGRR